MVRVRLIRSALLGMVGIVVAFSMGCGGSTPTVLPLEAESAFDVAVGEETDEDSSAASSADHVATNDVASAEASAASTPVQSRAAELASSTPPAAASEAAVPAPTSTNAPTATPQPFPTPTPKPLPTPTVESVADMVERVRDGVVFIEVKACDGSYSGTGFVIDDTRIATAAHVVNDANLVIVNVGGERLNAQVVGIDANLDVALLSVPKALRQWHFTFADNVRIGDDALVMGFPDALDFTVTQGAVTAVDAKDPNVSAPVIRFDAAANGGNSGGPVVNRAGEVVGVVSSGRTDMQNTNYAIDGQAALTRIGSWASAKPYTPAGDCGPSTQALDGNVTVNASHPQASGVDDLFEIYVGGINSGLSEYSWFVLSSGFQAALGNQNDFVSSHTTSFLYGFTIESITDTPSGLNVEASFVSTQEPSYGPNGWPCAVWFLDYSLVPNEGHYLIDGATHRQGSPANCEDFR